MPVWLIPIAYTASSIVGAMILPRLEHALAPELALRVSTALAVVVLSTIASGMMALTGIVFSIAFVMLQFSAITYAVPRRIGLIQSLPNACGPSRCGARCSMRRWPSWRTRSRSGPG